MLDPRLIAPFEGGGLENFYKPWLTGDKAFEKLEDAYAWRGSIRKREGYSILAVLPTTPIQGIKTFFLNTSASIAEQTIGFSTTKAYLLVSTPTIQFNDISFFQTTGAAISWTGSVTDFFWTSNFAGSLWTTNNVDPLRFWNGTPGNLGITGGWNNQRPTLNGTNVLQKCGLIIPHKGRLITLDTTEGILGGAGNRFFQRARWCQIGTPYVPATGGDPVVVPPGTFVTDASAWRDDIPGRGGFNDADTTERIVSCAIVRDVLIVFFQNSTWRLTYTGNEVLPFKWDRLNTQYGSESMLSTISFDEGILTFSRRGFIESDTNQVARIDEKIPDQTFFDMKYGASAATLQYIQGIRDYYRQTAYWCYQDTETAGTGNNRILSYNYLDETWAIFKQPFRTFGYYKQFFDLQWQNATFSWSSANFPWQGPEQLQFPLVLAGDVSNGNVYVVYDVTNNASDMEDPLVPGSGVNFGFDIRTKRFNPYISQGLKAKLSYIDIYCTMNPEGEITVNHYVDDQASPVITKKMATYYRGVINLSNITPGIVTTLITTTQNHDLDTGQFVTIGAIAGSIGNVLNNQTFSVTVITPTTFTIVVNTNGLVYSSGGYIYQKVQPQGDATYTRVYLGAIAHMHQIQFTLSEDQKNDPIKGKTQFELQGIVGWFRPCGRIRG